MCNKCRPLEDIFESIVRNKHIRGYINAILSNPTSNIPTNIPNMFKSFVDYQKKFYDKGKGLEYEGFQGGIPWVGNLKNAPVLFLSSNPAFTYNQCNPRYHADDDNWTIYKADNNGRVCREPIDFNGVWNFFTYPLSQAKNPLGSMMVIKNADKQNPLLTVNIFDGGRIKPKNGGVSFWKDLVRKILVKLNDSKKLLNRNINAGNLTATDLTELVEKTVFTEIVPFQSLKQVGVNKNSVDFCWNNFSKDILCHSAAKLWVIVGSHARDKLSKIMQSGGGVFSNVRRVQFPNDNGQPLPLETGGIYQLYYNGQPRTLWVIPHPNAGRKKGDLTLDKFVNNVQPNIWDALISSI